MDGWVNKIIVVREKEEKRGTINGERNVYWEEYK